MTLPSLTCTLHPDDYRRLAPELQVVDAHFERAAPQHPARRWEYALALHALTRWQADDGQHVAPPLIVYDIGGAGSPFWHMVPGCRIVDPLAESPHWPMTLTEFCRAGVQLAHVVTCLSVAEHVPAGELPRFWFELGTLVAPDGLLILTMDCRENQPPHDVARRDWPPPFPRDDRHFSWMRQQIFTPKIVSSLLPFHFAGLGFNYYGGVDLHWQGPHVYDYSFASCVLKKGRG